MTDIDLNETPVVDNALALACIVASNVAAAVREALEEEDHGYICDAWQELEAADEPKAIAVLRATLNRESKKLYGHGLTYKNGELVKAQARQRKPKGNAKVQQMHRTIDTLTADELEAVAEFILEYRAAARDAGPELELVA